jgi:predicted negative regulator of RcsB-dependent stress response
MTDHSLVFSIMTALVLLTIVFVFGMKYFSAARQTKVLADSQAAYQKLAEIAAAAEAASAASLSALQSDFAEMKSRLASIEKILSQV